MKLSSTNTLIIPIITFKFSTQQKVKNLSKLRKNLEFRMSYNDIIYYLSAISTQSFLMDKKTGSFFSAHILFM